MKIKRPAVLFLLSSVLGIIIAIEFVSVEVKLILFVVAIFLYGKLFFDGKLYIRTLIIILIFGIIGFGRFKIEERTFDNYAANIESLGKGNKIITGKVASIGRSTNSNYYVLENCFSNGLDLGTCRCYFPDNFLDVAKIGNLVKVVGGTTVFEEPSNEGEFNQKNFYRSYGITFMVYANEIDVSNAKYDKLRQKIYEIKVIIKSQIKKIFNEKDAGLFSAMVTGDKSEIDKDQRKRFSDNGIAHILAISGLHLSILGLALFNILRKKLSVNAAAGFVSVFILLYGIFIDAGPASLRAITMLFIRFLSLAIGRTYDSKNTLYIIAFIFLMQRPYLLFNAGFQFSYVAIFALNNEVNILRVTKKNKNVDDSSNNIIVAVKEEKKRVPAVIILTLFLFPITIYHYFTYPLYSIILNLIVIPLMSFVLGFGLLGLATSFINVTAGKILAYIVHIIFIIYDTLCELIEKLPAHLLVIGRPNIYEVIYFYIVIFVIIKIINDNTEKSKNEIDLCKKQKVEDYENSKAVLYKKIKLRQLCKISICLIFLLFAVLVSSIRTRSDMRMTFISIGQGDGIIIENKDLVISIDGGSSSNKSNGQYVLSPHIKSRGINHIDYSFITHADADHTNGIIYLLEEDDEIVIKNLVLPITAENDSKFDKIRNDALDRGTNIIYMKETDIKQFNDKLLLTVLSPNEESLNSKKIDQNEMSLTFRVDYNNHSALFTGDIGKETMNRMIKDEFDVSKMDVDVLKVPHHGSKNSNVPEFFEIVSPKYSVFSYGKNNNYGHPNGETVDSIIDTGSKVLKTGAYGQIDIYFDDDNIAYKTYKLEE